MQRKHLIAFTLVTIFLLLGFNIINTNRHEQSRSGATPVDIESESATVSESTNAESNRSQTNDTDIAAQPLGQQPKAIIDEVTADIDQAQQADQQRLEQTLESAE